MSPAVSTSPPGGNQVDGSPPAAIMTRRDGLPLGE